MANNGALAEILRNQSGKTWTLGVIPQRPDVPAGVGEDWEELPDAFKGEQT